MLNINNLTIGFADIDVVENVSLEIKERDKMVIIGETGSGKSMLILAIMKLLSSNANVQGEILYKNENTLKMSTKEIENLRGNEIGYIGQGSGNGLNPLLKIGYQVSEMDIEKKQMDEKSAFQKSISLLKKFNLGQEEKIVTSYPHILSGGMKQRVMVAMGISQEPNLILPDEPTKGLDNERIKLVEEAFLNLEDKTLLCVTHDIRFAKKISNKVCLLYAGEQLEVNSTEDFFKEPLHPYGKAMIHPLPENGLEVNLGFAPMRSEKTKTCKFFPDVSIRLLSVMKNHLCLT